MELLKILSDATQDGKLKLYLLLDNISDTHMHVFGWTFHLKGLCQAWGKLLQIPRQSLQHVQTHPSEGA